ncbi:hypothetical protein [Providencia sneebia]|nr:hypothetical protein [Providencia sneebia]
MKNLFRQLLDNKYVSYIVSGFMMLFLGIPPVEAEDYYSAKHK